MRDTNRDIDGHARALMESSPHPTVAYDPESLGIVYANPAAIRESGYASERLAGMTMGDLVTTERPAEPQGHGGQYGAWTLRRADGSTFDAEVSLIDLPGAGGALRVAVAQRLEEQARLRRLNEQQRALTEFATHPDFVRGDVTASLRHAVRMGSDALGVGRAGFWRLHHDPLGLRSAVVRTAGEGFDGADRWLSADGFPDYLAAVGGERAVDVEDAVRDPRTRELAESYLAPENIGAMLDCAVRLRGEVYGVLCFEHLDGPRRWLDDEIRFAAELADQVTQVLLNAERNHYVTLLHELAEGVAPETGQAFFRAVVRNLGQTLGACHVHIASVDDACDLAHSVAIAEDGVLLDNFAYALAGTPGGQALRVGVHVVTREVQDCYPNDRLLAHLQAEGFIGTRLQDSEGRTIGLLAAVFREPMDLPGEILALMRIFAVRAASELERLASERHLRRAAAVFRHTVEGIVVADAEQRIVEVNPAFAGMTGQQAEGLIGSPLLATLGIPEHRSRPDPALSMQRHGHWEGETECLRLDGSRFPAWCSITSYPMPEPDRSQTVALVSDISRIRESEADLSFLAHHDPLTGLPNRSTFRRHLDRALETARAESTRLAVLFIDLDGFKDINDSLGHDAGDRLLTDVAQRLAGSIRGDDTLARVGGDEFMLLLPAPDGRDDAARAARRLLNAFRAPFHADGHGLTVTTSVGVALYPHDGRDADTLIRAADTAMYRAKHEGRDTYWFYTEDLTARAYERIALVTSLRAALQHDRLQLAYQPVCNLETGEITAYEALVRWPDGAEEHVPTEELIAAAENSGLILPLSNWVFNEACAQLRRLQDAGQTSARMSINVSPAHLHRGDLVDDLLRAARSAGVSPGSLMVEVTETLIMRGAARAGAALGRLRELGMDVAVDDFGTGYSSLSYLKRLPLSVLKLDKSFTRDLPHDEDGAAIARVVIALARNLGLRVIAEGIETPAQLAFLRREGCTHGQGYLLGRPSVSELPATGRQALS